MSSEIARIISNVYNLEQLGTGFGFTEGPVWNQLGRYLLFSDLVQNKIRKWSPAEGITDFRVPSGKSNALLFDKYGRLMACEHINRRISCTEPDGSIFTIVSHYNGKRLNSPNDLIMKSDGCIYFTDPPFGLTAEFGELGHQELDFSGVYRISPDGKTITLLIDDFDAPNGLAFSPDESLLYIDDSERMHIRVFDVKDDGTIYNGRVFAKQFSLSIAIDPRVEWCPDGLKVDSEGNVYCTGPGGIWIFNPAGIHLGTIPVAEQPANFAWGEDDWKTLFITASTSLYRIPVNVPGIQAL